MIQQLAPHLFVAFSMNKLKKEHIAELFCCSLRVNEKVSVGVLAKLAPNMAIELSVLERLLHSQLAIHSPEM